MMMNDRARNIFWFTASFAFIFFVGVFLGTLIKNTVEKQACEYAEKAECKQVWVKK